MSFLAKTRSRAYTAAAIALVGLGVAACNKDKLLQVTDPDILNIDDYATPDGAEALRVGVIARFNTAFDGGTDSFVSVTGNMSDEILTSDTFDGRLTINARKSAEVNSEMSGVYNNMQRARAFAELAASMLLQSTPDSTTNLGQVYAYLGYTETFLGEGWCPGIPFSSEDGTTMTYGEPLTSQEVFEHAVVHFDSALAFATGTSSAATAVRNLASVGKGRALLNLGRYAEAATAVAGVPQSFKAVSSHSNQSSSNGVWSAISNGQTRYRLASLEGELPGGGTNGLQYLDTLSSDPRIPWKKSGRIGFSSQFLNQPDQTKYGRFDDGIVANGIEAKLIGIEAQLQDPANDQAVFDALNALRASGPPVVPAMAAGSKPADHNGMVDLFFKERAFWLWLTGHRLGDQRRLVRNYARGAETVFSSGELGTPYLMTTIPVAGEYGTSTAITIPFQERNNPNFQGCLDGV
jgi:hypothetical protein